MKKQINNKGAFRGSPLSALLFIFYFDNMLEMYTKDQKAWKNNQEIQKITVKNQEQEDKWTMRKYWNNIRKEGEGKLITPDYQEMKQGE